MAHSQSIAAGSGRTWSSRPGQAANGRRHSVGSAHWRAVARHARAIRQLELGLRALHPLEQARRMGCSLRDAGFSPASHRRGTCHRFDDRAGAPACSRRKRGNQNQEALGRSRGGFSTKIHLRTNAKGDPLTFDVTGGEAHEVKGYDALMRLHDANPSKLLGDKGYDSDDIRRDLIDRGIEPVIPPRSNRKTPEKRQSNMIAKPTNDATSSSAASIASSSSVASLPVTRKPPERSSPCYASQPQGFGLKLSTRPSSQ